MPCPFLKNGLCTSPLLGEPRADVVREEVCEGDRTSYTRCPYYTEKGLETLQAFTVDDVIRKLKPDPLLHYMRKKPEPRCKEMKVYEIAGHYVAYCQLLGRLLTRYETELCITHAEGCPIKKALNPR